MKRGVTAKLKFRQLQRRLGLTLYETRGLLDTLWDAAYDNAPAGDIGRLTNEEIAILIDWRGDPDDLVNALVEKGWLDADPDRHRLIIHDWSEHCQGWHVGNFAKYGKQFADVDYKARMQARNEAPNEPRMDAAPSLTSPFLTSPSPCASETDACADPPKPADGEPPPAKARRRKRPPPKMPPIPTAIDTPEVRAAWDDWLADRSERRSPVTSRAAKMQLRELESLGADHAVECLELAINREWTGIKAEWFRNARDRSGTTRNGHPSKAELDRQRRREREYPEDVSPESVPTI